MNASAGDAAGSADGGSGPGRYLIGSCEGELIDELADLLSADDRVRVIRRPTVGVLTVETTAPVLEELRGRYNDRVVIEPDVELDSLPPVGPDTLGP
jgi:hypothetical protein